LKFRIKRLEIYISYLLPAVIFAAILAGRFLEYLVLLLLITLHEAGHILYANLLGCRIHSISFLPVGLNAGIDTGKLSHRCRIAVNISGPLVNGVLFISGLLIAKDSNGAIYDFFIYPNLYLAVFNILPIWPLDGSKILQDLLLARTGLLFATGLIRALSAILAIILIAAGAVLIVVGSLNLSLIVIGGYILYAVRSEKIEMAYLDIKNILNRRSHLKKKKMLPARVIVVLQSVSLGELIKALDFDNFHIIHILDDSFALVKTITEQEAMDGMMRCNASVTLKELVDGIMQE
jgi:stage IV sporulation protein FB